MTRLLTVLAATAVAAAAAAAITLPAGADQPEAATDAKFVTCLRAHGLGVPADARGAAIKQWIGAQGDDPAIDPALRACKLAMGGDDVSPPELVACLRDHGLSPPATIDQLKPWMAQQDGTDAGRAALHACGFDAHPSDKPHPGSPNKHAATCGAEPAGRFTRAG